MLKNHNNLAQLMLTLNQEHASEARLVLERRADLATAASCCQSTGWTCRGLNTNLIYTAPFHRQFQRALWF